jgi:mRNA interferase MazF
MTPKRSEVWLVDLGLAAKVRPCLILSVAADDPHDRSLTTFIPHTTSTRSSRFEVELKVRFLKEGAFDFQNLSTIPTVKFIRRLGELRSEEMWLIEDRVKDWLGLASHQRPAQT